MTKTTNFLRIAMPRTISAAHAKTHLAECLRVVEAGESVIITRYGKIVAALVAAEDLEQLERLRAAGEEAGLGGLLKRWEDSAELADALDEVVAVRAPVRTTPDFR